MESLRKIKLQYWVLYLIYPTVFLVQYFRMMGIQLNKYIHIPFLLLFIVFSIGKIINFVQKESKNHMLMLLYLFYVLTSIVWYISNGVPLEAYINNLRLFVIPILFYFWGADKQETTDTFYKVFLISMTICVVIAIYLYISLPSYYVSYMLEVRQNSTMGSQWQNEANIMDNNRLSGFFESSYAISYMGMSSFCICISNLIKNRIRFPFYLIFTFAIIHLLGIILCMQRIAWGMSFIYLLFYFICNKKEKQNKIAFIIVVIAIAVFLYAFNSRFSLTDRLSDLKDLLFNRWSDMDFKKAMSGRTNQYDQINLFSIDKLLGNGLGSGGRYATIYLGQQGVADGEYIKQIIEFGWLGLILLFSLFINSLLKVANHYKYYYLEIMIVLFYIAAGIGHNSFNSYFYTYMFWYALGRLNNPAYKERLLFNS